jgi:hypothetical protein
MNRSVAIHCTLVEQNILMVSVHSTLVYELVKMPSHLYSHNIEGADEFLVPVARPMTVPSRTLRAANSVIVQ